VDLLITKGNQKSQQRFYITDLGGDRWILGYPFFKKFNPDINWTNSELKGPKVQMETLLFGKLQRLKQHAKNIRQQNNDSDFTISEKTSRIRHLNSDTSSALGDPETIEIDKTTTGSLTDRAIRWHTEKQTQEDAHELSKIGENLQEIKRQQ
jgi:hypothetical protein